MFEYNMCRLQIVIKTMSRTLVMTKTTKMTSSKAIDKHAKKTTAAAIRNTSEVKAKVKTKSKAKSKAKGKTKKKRVTSATSPNDPDDPDDDGPSTVTSVMAKKVAKLPPLGVETIVSSEDVSTWFLPIRVASHLKRKSNLPELADYEFDIQILVDSTKPDGKLCYLAAAAKEDSSNLVTMYKVTVTKPLSTSTVRDLHTVHDLKILDFSTDRTLFLKPQLPIQFVYVIACLRLNLSFCINVVIRVLENSNIGQSH